MDSRSHQMISDSIGLLSPPRQAPGESAGSSLAIGLRQRRWFRSRLAATLVVAASLLIFGGRLIPDIYKRWRLGNTVLLGQRWMEAGRFLRASEEVEKALALDSHRPEPWRLASQLAWKQGQTSKAFEYAAKAAEISENRVDYVLPWVRMALLRADFTEASHALAQLAPENLRASSPALRISAETAGRRGDYRAARDFLNAALAVDVKAGNADLRSDEAQLGMVLLQTGISEDRSRALELLARCSQSKDAVGRFALRNLLSDSAAKSNQAETAKWARALLAHPLCTLVDAHACLTAVAPADEATFGNMFAAVKKMLAPSQLRSAELLGWLGSMGRTKEALEWARSINAAEVNCPPLFVSVAEIFRQASQWRDLEMWTGLAEWGPGVSLLQLNYRWVALAKAGDTEMAEAALSELKGNALGKGPEAMLVAQLLYAWGLTDQAADLLWVLSRDPKVDIKAVGMLIRHYQVQRDSAGLHRAFAAWCQLRPNDRTATVSCAFFGSLAAVGDPARFEQIAAENLIADPANGYFRCCYGAILAMNGHGARALDVLAPISADWRKSSSIAFAYGLALANAGRSSEAREVLSSIDPKVLNSQQAALCESVLK